MEMINEIVLVCEKNDRRYRMHIPAGSPLGEAHDAAFEMLLQVDAWHKENVEKLKEKKEAEGPQAEGAAGEQE